MHILYIDISEYEPLKDSYNDSTSFDRVFDKFKDFLYMNEKHLPLGECPYIIGVDCRESLKDAHQILEALIIRLKELA